MAEMTAEADDREFIWRHNAAADCRKSLPTKGRIQQSLQEAIHALDALADERDAAESSAMREKVETQGWVNAYNEELVRRKNLEVTLTAVAALADEWEVESWGRASASRRCADHLRTVLALAAPVSSSPEPTSGEGER